MAVDFYRSQSSPKQKWSGSSVTFEKNVDIEGETRIEECTNMGPILIQQIYTIDLMDDETNWTATGTDFTATDGGTGPLANDGSLKLLQVDADGEAPCSVYRNGLGTSNIDLSPYDYIGYWYQGGNDDAFFGATDIFLDIFQGSETDHTVTGRCESYSAFPQFTESSTAVWKYREIALGSDREKRKAVSRIAFRSEAGTDGNYILVANMEAYRYSTGKGPAYGMIRRAPIMSGINVAQGAFLQWTSQGRVTNICDDSYAFAGICVSGGTGDAAGSVYADFQVDGVVNLEADEYFTAGDGVCITGDAASQIDDGGSSSEKLQIGVALVSCITSDVVPVLIGSRGNVGTVGA